MLYCEKCNTFRRTKFCDKCKNKIFNLQDFDDESIHSEFCSMSSKSTYISDDGFVVCDKQCLYCNEQKFYNQLCSEIEINKNLLNDTKDSISKLKKEACEFSLLILVNNNKKVFISQRINLFKDYYRKYQVVEGKKESNESFLDCAIHEAKEEAGVEIKIEDLNLIGTCEG
ncbi:6284_t:CDS:2, partial [Cetraspora pellucida]